MLFLRPCEAEKMRQTCPFNPLSQKFCDPRLEENMRACGAQGL